MISVYEYNSVSEFLGAGWGGSLHISNYPFSVAFWLITLLVGEKLCLVI